MAAQDNLEKLLASVNHYKFKKIPALSGKPAHPAFSKWFEWILTNFLGKTPNTIDGNEKLPQEKPVPLQTYFLKNIKNQTAIN